MTWAAHTCAGHERYYPSRHPTHGPSEGPGPLVTSSLRGVVEGLNLSLVLGESSGMRMGLLVALLWPPKRLATLLGLSL